MLNEFISFRKDISEANPLFKIWGPVLNFSLIFGGFYFYEHTESILISITTILSLIIAIKIHGKLPNARILGVCHVVWLPLYPFLILKTYNGDISNYYDYFIIWSAVLMTISLIFDVFDFYRYIFTDNKTYSKKF